MQHKLGFFSPLNPLMMALPFGLSFLRFRGPRWFRGKRKWRRPGFLGSALLGWRLYRRFGPWVQRFLAQRFAVNGRAARKSAAESIS